MLKNLVDKLVSRRGFLGKLSARTLALTAAVLGMQNTLKAFECYGTQYGCCTCYPPDPITDCFACQSGYGTWIWTNDFGTGDCVECVIEGCYYDGSTDCSCIVFSCATGA